MIAQNMTTSPGRRVQHSGFSLIEVLIALVVLSIGLLGLAALQITALKHNQVALQRSQATAAAYGIFDRMRANKTAAENGAYTYAGAALAGTALASTDVNQWAAMLQNTVHPTATGTICNLAASNSAVCAATGAFALVTITWTEAGEFGAGNAPANQTFSYVSGL